MADLTGIAADKDGSLDVNFSNGQMTQISSLYHKFRLGHVRQRMLDVSWSHSDHVAFVNAWCSLDTMGTVADRLLRPRHVRSRRTIAAEFSRLMREPAELSNWPRRKC
ncbi:hypothetical protein ACVILK_007552 [Bradyrhizobium embrapense]